MIAVGSVGTKMSVLLQLVCRVANLTQFKIDFTSESSFMDGLRSVVRMTGSEGRTLAVIISARDLTDELYLHTLNSLLISGDYPTLFSTDEIDGLYQALGPQIRRDFPNEPVDPEKFFIFNVMRNLHVFFTLPPTNSLVHRAARLDFSNFPMLRIFPAVGLKNDCSSFSEIFFKTFNYWSAFASYLSMTTIQLS